MLAIPAPRHSDEPFVESVLCATDFSATGLNAFAHALMIAVTLRCSFTLFHAGEDHEAEVDWHQIPGVRNVLETWGYLEKGSPRSAVFQKMAVAVRKVHVRAHDALAALPVYLRNNPADLVVIGTDGHSKARSWLRPAKPQPIAWDSRTMTLFVPPSGGFVSMEHGGFTLRRVLVPVNNHPDPQPAINYAFRAAVFSSEDVVDMDLLHIGDAPQHLRVELPERDYLRWELISRVGNVTDEILRAASELNPGMIAMTTDGAGGMFGEARGRIVEQIVRGASCPVLAVPVAE